MKYFFTAIFLFFFTFALYAQNNQDYNSYCLSEECPYQLCQVCTNDEIQTENIILNTFGLKHDAIGHLTYIIYFDTLIKSDTIYPLKGNLVRLTYTEAHHPTYFMNRDFLTEEEMFFFQLLDEQIWKMVFNKRFFLKMMNEDDELCDSDNGYLYLNVTFRTTTSKHYNKKKIKQMNLLPNELN